MTMQLLEALTILAAGNCGELNYSANEETRAIFNEARRVVGHTATQLVDARHLTSRAGGFIPKTEPKTDGPKDYEMRPRSQDPWYGY